MNFNQAIQVSHHVWWDGLFYTEGPVVDADGVQYFTTLSGGAIMKGGSEEQVTSWGASLCPNGQAILPGGDLVVCDTKESALKRFDKRGNFLCYEVKEKCAGVEFLSPNDVITDTAGGLYFTDSTRYQGRVFYKGVDGTEQVVAEGLDYPNGLVLSSTSDRLFVAESYRNRVLELTLQPNGVAACRVFSELPKHETGREIDNLPDGMALDIWGNLWVAHYGMEALQVLDSNGNLIATIHTGIPLTSNLCFLGFNPVRVMVTGGFGEPGPGRVVIITIKQSVSS